MVRDTPPPPLPPSSKPDIEDYIAFHGMLCNPSQARRCVHSFTGTILFADQSVYDKLLLLDDVDDNDDKDRESSSSSSSSSSVDGILSSVDYSRTILPLSVMTYYLLVIVTFTGLCTLLGYTKMKCQRQERQCFTKNRPKTSSAGGTYDIEAECRKNHLRIPSQVIDYVLEQSLVKKKSLLTPPSAKDGQPPPSPPPIIELRFKQRFEFEFGGYFTAVMFHFECSNGYKHLIETYQFHQTPVLDAFVRLVLTINQILEPFRHVLTFLSKVVVAKKED